MKKILVLTFLLFFAKLNAQKGVELTYTTSLYTKFTAEAIKKQIMSTTDNPTEGNRFYKDRIKGLANCPLIYYLNMDLDTGTSFLKVKEKNVYDAEQDTSYHSEYEYSIKEKDNYVIKIILDNEKMLVCSEKDLTWEITDEVKSINNYKCQKAILKNSPLRAEAWFTTDVPIKVGPVFSDSLPGLTVQYKTIAAILTLKEIKYIEKNTVVEDIKKVREKNDKLKKINYKEYNTLIENMIKLYK